MNKLKQTRQQKRQRRQVAIRSRLVGLPNKPRLVVHRSLQNIFAQIIDDTAGKTLVSLHSKKIDSKADARSASSGQAGERKGKVAVAYLLGKELAELAGKAGISQVVFDRAGFRYHGRVKALADGAREGGLVF